MPLRLDLHRHPVQGFNQEVGCRRSPRRGWQRLYQILHTLTMGFFVACGASRWSKCHGPNAPFLSPPHSPHSSTYHYALYGHARILDFSCRPRLDVPDQRIEVLVCEFTMHVYRDGTHQYGACLWRGVAAMYNARSTILHLITSALGQGVVRYLPHVSSRVQQLLLACLTSLKPKWRA